MWCILESTCVIALLNTFSDNWSSLFVLRVYIICGRCRHPLFFSLTPIFVWYDVHVLWQMWNAGGEEIAPHTTLLLIDTVCVCALCSILFCSVRLFLHSFFHCYFFLFSPGKRHHSKHYVEFGWARKRQRDVCRNQRCRTYCKAK